jgi:hypothetical protein
MTSAKVFKIHNRLAKAVSGGGLTAQQAIPAAQAQVEKVRQPTLDEIDAALRRIYALTEDRGAAMPTAALEEVYEAANHIIAVAGLFDLAELGQAAWSLCELTSRCVSSGRFNRCMVDVHIDGLRLLRHPSEHNEAQRTAVLLGLRQVAASMIS